MKRVIVGTLVAVAAVTAMTGCGKAGKDGGAKGEVLARINDKVITMDDFKKEQEKLPPYIKASVETAEGKKQFLNSLVTKELILQKAEKAGIEKDEGVVSRLEDIRKTLMIETMLKKEIEGKASFTEKEAEEYYNSHKDEFKEGEKVKISHIMLKTEKEAKDILNRLNRKENFENLAKKYSVAGNASKGGEIGYIQRGSLIPEFEEAAFKLKKVGDISPVVAAASGFHIIKLLERKDAENQPFEKVKGKIVETQGKKRQKEAFDSFVSSLKKEASLTVNDSVFEKEVKKDTPVEEKKGEVKGEKKEGSPSK